MAVPPKSAPLPPVGKPVVDLKVRATTSVSVTLPPAAADLKVRRQLQTS